MTKESHSGSESYLTAEARARVQIDQELEAARWAVQDADAVNLAASLGVAVREFILKSPHGRADYLLFVDRQAVGSVEAKPAGTTLTGVEIQSAKYRDGLPDLEIPAPLPYCMRINERRFTHRAVHPICTIWQPLHATGSRAWEVTHETEHVMCDLSSIMSC
jgi:type I site-specific restriction endonuclease